MQQSNHKISSIIYSAAGYSLLLTLIMLFTGFIIQGLVFAAFLMVYVVFFGLNQKGKVLLTPLIFTMLIEAVVFDTGLFLNDGIIFLYFPILLFSFLYLPNTKVYLRNISFIIFLLFQVFINYTELTPKLFQTVNNTDVLNIVLFLNFIFSFGGVYFLLLNGNKLAEHNSSAGYEIALENTPNLIWQITHDFKLELFNKSYEQFFIEVWNKPPVKGSSDILPQGNQDKLNWEKLIKKALSGEQFKQQLSLLKDNQTLYYDFTFNPVIKNNEVKGAVIIGTNLTTLICQQQKESQALKNLQLIISSTDEVFYEINADDICTNVWHNQSIKTPFLISDIVGKHVKEILDQPYELNISKFLKQTRELKQRLNYEFSLQYANKQKHYVAKIRLVDAATDNRCCIILEDITERKQLQLNQSKQSDFLNKLVNNLPVGIFAKDVKNNLTYTLWNKELERLFGISQVDVIGKTDNEVFSNIGQIEAYSATDKMVIEDKEPVLISKLNINSGGETIIARTIKLPIIDKDGNVDLVIGFLENITEITRAQDELAAAENRWYNALIGSRDAVWDINLETDEVFYSPMFKQMLGYGLNESPPSSLDSIIHPDDVNAVNEKYKQHLSGLTAYFEAEYRIRKTNGEYIWILDRGQVSHYNEDGKPSRVVGTFTDITYKKELEDELIKAKERAEEASKAKSLFLSTMSHEIRTPMNAINGIINLLISQPRNDSEKEQLNGLKFAAENLMYLLNDILDFSKIEAGKLEFENAEFSLIQLVQNIKNTFAAKAAEKNIMLDVKADEQIPAVLVGDQAKIGQIINNLVSNAVKFTEEGNITLEIISKENNETHAFIEIIVSDTGIGIDNERLDTIFDEFAQAHEHNHLNTLGTGLGLAISKKLLALMGSEIFVSSTVGIGSKFWFTLKLPYTKKIVVEPNKETTNLTGTKLNGLRVLVVEDNKLNIFVITKFLGQWGVTFEVAENGAIAVNEAKKKTFDLILMDLHMPVLDGLEATKQIRQFNSTIPIYALTANALSDIKTEVYAAGMNDFITKPFDPNELLKKLIKIYTEIKKKPISFKLFD